MTEKILKEFHKQFPEVAEIHSDEIKRLNKKIDEWQDDYIAIEKRLSEKK